VGFTAGTRLASFVFDGRIYDVHAWSHGEGVVLAALDPDSGDDPIWTTTLPFGDHYVPLRAAVTRDARGLRVTVDAEHAKGSDVRVFDWIVAPAGEVLGT